MNAPDTKLDRADWKRYSKTNTDRCVVCGNRAAVTVSLSAAEKGEGRNNPMLAKQSFPYCHDHGILRFGDALHRLNGGAARTS